jgi:hypothetical protein
MEGHGVTFGYLLIYLLFSGFLLELPELAEWIEAVSAQAETAVGTLRAQGSPDMETLNRVMRRWSGKEAESAVWSGLGA